MPARLPYPLAAYDKETDTWPNDDYLIERWKAENLNRIDQGHGCDHLVSRRALDIEYCGLPEHDPFTNRCYDHLPVEYPHTGHM